MKKYLTLALALMMALSLAACGGKTDPAPSGSGTADPGTSQTEPSDAATENSESVAPDATTPDTTTPEAASGEIMDFDIGISAVPAEWQKGIGKSLYGMNTGAMGDCSDSYTNKFGSVSAEDYAKLIAYFDTLSYTEKLDGVYNCDWGQLQIGHNAGASEMTITWLAF